MNTVKSFWVGWGSLCVAGAGAYYFAKREINADRQAKLAAHHKKRQDIRAMEHGIAPADGSSQAATTTSRFPGAPGADPNADPAPAAQDVGAGYRQRDKEDASPYESQAGYRSRKGDRFS